MSVISPRQGVAAGLLALTLLLSSARAGTLDFQFDSFGANEARGRLDLGNVMAGREGRVLREARVRERIAVRLQAGVDAPASARVSVALLDATPGAQIRIDGVLVGPMPRVIDATHRVGIWVAHDIEVTVSSDLPAGPLLEALQWFAETE